MSILVDEQTRVIIQGITGREGQFHTERMIDYGTNIVGGVSPGKGGEWIKGKPVFDTVKTAVATTGATTTIIMVPPLHAYDAILEAITSKIELIICITEGIPLRDMMIINEYLSTQNIRFIGPNSFGLLTPNRVKLGTMPENISIPGHIGIISKSGALTYEVTNSLAEVGLGQSTVIGIGADPIIGMDFVDALILFEEDPETHVIVLIGEIGGYAEKKAADYIVSKMTKPIVAFVAGSTAPKDTQMGHAGAISASEEESAESKINALKNAGVRVVNSPDLIAEAILYMRR